LICCWRRTLGQFIELDQCVETELLVSGGRLRGEGIMMRIDIRLPVFDLKRVLGCAVQGLAGDHQLARNGPIARLHPELPIRIQVAEGEVLAFDPSMTSWRIWLASRTPATRAV
jgi:hypothetical protein